MEFFVDEAKLVEFLRQQVEPQHLFQILEHFKSQTPEETKWSTIVQQLLEVLKTSTESGVIYEESTFYFANTHVEDVQRIMMDEDDWFIPSAGPSETSLGSTNPTQVPTATAATKSPESLTNSESTQSTLSNCNVMSAEATMSISEDD
ncbi:uncharacterized protein LOC124460530 [Drosophila willistoni]|uniref:uncharacterized protein LOC124460530 n=1 Tax=Drosophila willistoni TaxID=7260 RepID=UPI001F082D29|nr:uncharacterized protein LOC124460530 [Drosophila willistoni]